MQNRGLHIVLRSNKSVWNLHAFLSVWLRELGIEVNEASIHNGRFTRVLNNKKPLPTSAIV